MRHEVFIQFITYTETEQEARDLADRVASEIIVDPNIDMVSCQVESFEHD